jgi:hypothetical protein
MGRQPIRYIRNGGRRTEMPKPKANYVPKKRDWIICPICGKQFSISGAEHRSRIKRGFKEPCCSKECGQAQRKKNNSH